MMKKLRSRAGETLTETLVALLISALALLMLAGAVTSATRVITRSKDKMTEYYAADAALANRTGTGNTLRRLISSLRAERFLLAAAMALRISLPVYSDMDYFFLREGLSIVDDCGCAICGS